MIYRICIAILLCFWAGECLHAQTPCNLIISPPNMNVCSNTEVATILTSNVEGQTIEWTVPPGVTVGCPSDINCTSSSLVKLSNFNAGNNDIILTISDNSGQVCKSTITIFNSQITTAEIFTADNMEVCGIIPLQANEPVLGNGTWSANSNSVTFQGGINNPNVVATDLAIGINNICWTITNGGCSSEDCIEVINEAPVDARVENNSVLVGCVDEIELNAFVFDMEQAGHQGIWTSDAPGFVPTDDEVLDELDLPPGNYTFTWTTTNPNSDCPSNSVDVEVIICEQCDVATEVEEVCESSFAPIPGRRYVLSAWVKGALSADKLTYENISIVLTFGGMVGSFTFSPEGGIIDGWQRIEEEFTVPAGAATFNIQLHNTDASAQAFFDDIRVHPFDANMKSFVYDPVTLRLTAELDERNYATYYEYDEEGALIRIKKETERGVMTIQEGRSSLHKIEN